MILTNTNIDKLVVIEPKVYGDSRGYFFESYNNEKFIENGLEFNFIQDNEAKSTKGVLRGLHFQNPPFAQTKLIRVIKGEILDVVIDLRISSKTYGKSFSIILNDENKKQLLVPKGFAHGYIVLSEEAIVSYKVDEKYLPETEGGIIWNDHYLNIDWKLNHSEIKLSAKDKEMRSFNEFKSPFK
ncbi:MAG: dTDP-4-dehydrorhamnose 3,5-epimerase [Flavobacteriia bacterium]